MNINKVILGGHLTADPELKQTTNGNTIATFKIAINRKTKDKQEADFFNCIVFGKTAEMVSTYFHKGNAILVAGSARNRSYEKDGQKHYITEFPVDEVHFVEKKGYSEPDVNLGADIQPPANFEPVGDDLPF